MNLPAYPHATRPCPAEKCLAVLSHGWVARILWHLFRSADPVRFADLLRALDGISAKVLTQKLRLLEREELVLREVVHTVPPQVSYSVTDRGKVLIPVYDAVEAAALDLYG